MKAIPVYTSRVSRPFGIQTGLITFLLNVMPILNKTFAIRCIAGMIICGSLCFCLPACVESERTHVGLQVLGNFSEVHRDSIASALSRVYGVRTIILQPRSMPQEAFVHIKAPRYRADVLLKFLKGNRPDSLQYIMGLTMHDISTTKKDALGRILKPEHRYRDWGIFGLGYVPGPSSILSGFRIKTVSDDVYISRLQKIGVHELGHNFGLKHCSTPQCVMNDAVERVQTIDEAQCQLCTRCSLKLKIGK